MSPDPKRLAWQVRARARILAFAVMPSLSAIVATALLLAATAVDRAGASGLDVSHFTLANGLEVVVIPDHRAPVVTHMVWYKVGSADETARTIRALRTSSST